MNCSDVDAVVADVERLVVDTDGGFVTVMLLLLAASGILLAQGERFVRPICAVVAGLSASAGTLFLTSLADSAMPCWVRLSIVGLAGVCAAVLALCIVKTGLFLLGAVGFGVVGHFAYETLPLENVAAPFVLAGRSGYYYLTVLASAAVGAIASQWQRTHFIRISSSLLGGAGIALTVHLVFERVGEGTVPPLALLFTMLGSAGGGIALQSYVETRRKRHMLQRANQAALVGAQRV